jgi:Domain of unknown function (DUF3883)
MNIHELREAQVRYQNKIEEIVEARKELHKLRNSFVNFFDINKVKSMEINDYVAGVELPKKGYNFCYTLERKLDGLGRISGSSAPKFGIYFGKRGKKSIDEYQFVSRFGENYYDAFRNVRKAISELIIDGENGNIENLTQNPISNMVKGKILCTYFPERYLNVFSPEHLNFFLKQLNLDNKETIKANPIIKRELLIKFKNQDLIMRNWSNDLFSHFLYTEYPGSPPKKGVDFNNTYDPLINYKTYDFPMNPNAEFINLDILPKSDKNTKYSNFTSKTKPDYENEARKFKKIGNRGEKIVLDLEIKRLNKLNRNDLAEKVIQVSLESDSFGYDILSFDYEGNKKYIEVKTTTAKVGNANFFLTSNELTTAKTIENYYIYMVYDILSENPKVWEIQNPFNPENENVFKTPTNYRVTIYISKK